MEVNIKTLEGVQVPQYKTEGAAGFDLKVHSFKEVYKGETELSKSTNVVTNGMTNKRISLRAHERVLLGTGIFMEIPVGYELQIRPRSGKAVKNGLTVSNSPGTIDSDYRGEICIAITNTTDSLARIELGEHIAQGVLAPYTRADFKVVDELSDTSRGVGGFGSTGK